MSAASVDPRLVLMFAGMMQQIQQAAQEEQERLAMQAAQARTEGGVIAPALHSAPGLHPAQQHLPFAPSAEASWAFPMFSNAPRAVAQPETPAHAELPLPVSAAPVPSPPAASSVEPSPLAASATSAAPARAPARSLASSSREMTVEDVMMLASPLSDVPERELAQSQEPAPLAPADIPELNGAPRSSLT